MDEQPIPLTPAPTDQPAKNWFDRLSPTYRAWVVGVLVLLANQLLGLAWGKLMPNQPAPVIPAPPVEAKPQ